MFVLRWRVVDSGPQTWTHQVGDQTRTSHCLDGLLGGLRLLLSIDNRHVRHMDLQEIVLARTAPELGHGLDKGHALDVAHSSTQFDYAHVRLLVRVVDGYPRNPLDPILNRIRDVWHDLHRLTQVGTFPLLLYDMLVDLARCDVVVACEGDVQVALIVAEIEVDFAAVREDEYFAVPVRCSEGVLKDVRVLYVLPWVHSSSVDIEIWVDLDRRHLQTLGLEQETGRGGCRRVTSA